MNPWKCKEWQEFYCDKLFIRSSLQMHYCKEIDGKENYAEKIHLFFIYSVNSCRFHCFSDPNFRLIYVIMLMINYTRQICT